MDPYVHYLQAGSPSGPWQPRSSKLAKNEIEQKVKQNVHFTFMCIIQNYSMILSGLKMNRNKFDIFITYNKDSQKRATVQM